MTLTMLSHHFLVKLRVEMGDQAPALTVAQVRKLLNVTLPMRQFDEEAVIAESNALNKPIMQRTVHTENASCAS